MGAIAKDNWDVRKIKSYMRYLHWSGEQNNVLKDAVKAEACKHILLNVLNVPRPLTGRRRLEASSLEPSENPVLQGFLMLLFLFVFYVIWRRFNTPPKPARVVRGVANHLSMLPT